MEGIIKIDICGPSSSKRLLKIAATSRLTGRWEPGCICRLPPASGLIWGEFFHCHLEPTRQQSDVWAQSSSPCQWLWLGIQNLWLILVGCRHTALCASLADWLCSYPIACRWCLLLPLPTGGKSTGPRTTSNLTSDYSFKLILITS